MKSIIFVTAALLAALAQAQGLCPETEYYTGYDCREKTIGQSEFCPVYANSPPPGGRVRCVNGGNNFWYIHVGGLRTDWSEDTDAQCLSTASLPAAWGRYHCQFAWNEKSCLDILRYAGCTSLADEVDGDDQSSEKTSSNEESEESSFPSDEQESCPNGKYFTGYDCREKTIGQSEFCPVDADTPPPGGRVRCVNGGNNFWYIHVGGLRTDWSEDTDAQCLSTASRPAVWGRDPCQFAWNEDGCLEILKYAGCVTAAADNYDDDLSSKETSSREKSDGSHSTSREKSHGSLTSSEEGAPNLIPALLHRFLFTKCTYDNSRAAFNCLRGVLSVHLERKETVGPEQRPSPGFGPHPDPEPLDGPGPHHRPGPHPSPPPLSPVSEEPLIRCKRPMCKMFCELGFQTDEQGCDTCHCLENPCAAIRCGGGEECKPKECESHPCTRVIAACVKPEDRPMPCAVPMCSNPCPYGYAKNEHGCDTCNCKNVKSLCNHVRDVEKEKMGNAPSDLFHKRKDDPEVVRDMKAKFLEMNLPQCEKNGAFVPRQCSPVKQACWCVDDRGAEIAYTRKTVDEYDVEEDLPQCERNRTTAIHMTFKMRHEIPNEDFDKHLPDLKSAVHAHLSHWLMVRKEFIEIIAVSPDTVIEHVVIVEFIVERDGNTDLPSAAHSMHRSMQDGKLKLPFKNTLLTPQPDTVTMEHKFDKPALPPQGLRGHESKTGRMCHRVRTFYRHHKVLTILAAVGGVILLTTITGVLICQCCRNRRSASMQFSHKRLETMEHFKHNLVMDFENHPDLVGEKKEKLSDDPVLVSSVNLDDGENKVSLA